MLLFLYCATGGLTPERFNEEIRYLNSYAFNNSPLNLVNFWEKLRNNLNEDQKHEFINAVIDMLPNYRAGQLEDVWNLWQVIRNDVDSNQKEKALDNIAAMIPKNLYFVWVPTWKEIRLELDQSQKNRVIEGFMERIPDIDNGVNLVGIWENLSEDMDSSQNRQMIDLIIEQVSTLKKGVWDIWESLKSVINEKQKKQLQNYIFEQILHYFDESPKTNSWDYRYKEEELLKMSKAIVNDLDPPQKKQMFDSLIEQMPKFNKISYLQYFGDEFGSAFDIDQTQKFIQTIVDKKLADHIIISVYSGSEYPMGEETDKYRKEETNKKFDNFVSRIVGHLHGEYLKLNDGQKADFDRTVSVSIIRVIEKYDPDFYGAIMVIRGPLEAKRGSLGMRYLRQEEQKKERVQLPEELQINIAGYLRGHPAENTSSEELKIRAAKEFKQPTAVETIYQARKQKAEETETSSAPIAQEESAVE